MLAPSQFHSVVRLNDAADYGWRTASVNADFARVIQARPRRHLTIQQFAHRLQPSLLGPVALQPPFVPVGVRRHDPVIPMAELCRILGVLLQPFLPGTAEKIFAQLRLPGTSQSMDLARWGGLAKGHAIGDPIPLFPRKDQPPKK